MRAHKEEEERGLGRGHPAGVPAGCGPDPALLLANCGQKDAVARVQRSLEGKTRGGGGEAKLEAKE